MTALRRSPLQATARRAAWTGWTAAAEDAAAAAAGRAGRRAAGLPEGGSEGASQRSLWRHPNDRTGVTRTFHADGLAATASGGEAAPAPAAPAAAPASDPNADILLLKAAALGSATAVESHLEGAGAAAVARLIRVAGEAPWVGGRVASSWAAALQGKLRAQEAAATLRLAPAECRTVLAALGACERRTGGVLLEAKLCVARAALRSVAAACGEGDGGGLAAVGAWEAAGVMLSAGLAAPPLLVSVVESGAGFGASSPSVADLARSLPLRSHGQLLLQGRAAPVDEAVLLRGLLEGLRGGGGEGGSGGVSMAQLGVVLPWMAGLRPGTRGLEEVGARAGALLSHPDAVPRSADGWRDAALVLTACRLLWVDVPIEEEAAAALAAAAPESAWGLACAVLLPFGDGDAGRERAAAAGAQAPLLAAVFGARWAACARVRQALLARVGGLLPGATDARLLRAATLAEAEHVRFARADRAVQAAVAAALAGELVRRNPTWRWEEVGHRPELVTLVGILDAEATPVRVYSVLASWLAGSVGEMSVATATGALRTLASVGHPADELEASIADVYVPELLRSEARGKAALELLPAMSEAGRLAFLTRLQGTDGFAAAVAAWTDRSAVVALAELLYNHGLRHAEVTGAAEGLLAGAFDELPEASGHLASRLLRLLPGEEDGEDEVESGSLLRGRALRWLSAQAARIDEADVPVALVLLCGPGGRSQRRRRRALPDAETRALFDELCGRVGGAAGTDACVAALGAAVRFGAAGYPSVPPSPAVLAMAARVAAFAVENLSLCSPAQAIGLLRRLARLGALTPALLEVAADEVLWRLLPEMTCEQVSYAAQVFSRLHAGFEAPQTLFWCIAEEATYRMDDFAPLDLVRCFAAVVRATTAASTAACETFAARTAAAVDVEALPLRVLPEYCECLALSGVDVAAATPASVVAALRRRTRPLLEDARCTPALAARVMSVGCWPAAAYAVAEKGFATLAAPRVALVVRGLALGREAWTPTRRVEQRLLQVLPVWGGRDVAWALRALALARPAAGAAVRAAALEKAAAERVEEAPQAVGAELYEALLALGEEAAAWRVLVRLDGEGVSQEQWLRACPLMVQQVAADAGGGGDDGSADAAAARRVVSALRSGEAVESLRAAAAALRSVPCAAGAAALVADAVAARVSAELLAGCDRELVEVVRAAVGVEAEVPAVRRLTDACLASVADVSWMPHGELMAFVELVGSGGHTVPVAVAADQLAGMFLDE